MYCPKQGTLVEGSERSAVFEEPLSEQQLLLERSQFMLALEVLVARVDMNKELDGKCWPAPADSAGPSLLSPRPLARSI